MYTWKPHHMPGTSSHLCQSPSLRSTQTFKQFYKQESGTNVLILSVLISRSPLILVYTCLILLGTSVIVFTYTPNLPKQQLIATVSQSSSPVTLARVQDFSDGITHPPQDVKHTLQQLFKICQEVDPWDVAAFQKKCKERGLLGVHLPFWRNWMLSCLLIFLVLELLHTCHKFFFDHLFKWCKEVVRSRELNLWYKSMHKHVGVCHFASSVCHVQQWLAGNIATSNAQLLRL